MILFRPLNTVIEKKSHDITIRNMHISNDHFGSEKNIVDLLEGVEECLYEKEMFDKKLSMYLIKNFVKNNRRIDEAKFFRVPEENKIVFYVLSDIRKFGDYEFFTRELNINFKKQKLSFSIVELTTEETKNKEIVFPSNWQYDEALTKKFDNLWTVFF